MKIEYNYKNIIDAIDKIASIPCTSYNVYYFSDKFIKEYPELFYTGNGKLYLKDNDEEVYIYNETYNTDGDHFTMYVIPIENAKPIKTVFEKKQAIKREVY